MAESVSTTIRDLSPPGELLEEALEERGMTNAELARRTGLSEKHVSQLVNARVSLSMDVALQLERVLGIPARLWNSLEFNYRSERKREEQREQLRGWADWMRRFPVRPMVHSGYLPAVGQDVVSRVDALLNFFGVSSAEAWEQEWRFATARFRKSPKFQPDPCALTAWLRRGALEAQAIRSAAYDENRFREALLEARALSTEEPDVFQVELKRVCAEAGVAVAFIPSLPKLAVSGATRWIGPRKAAVFLSLRHKSDDQLWFSFFHEACHVLEHKTGSIYIDALGDRDDDAAERRANEFARDRLIPPADYRRLAASGKPSFTLIKRFAKELGISPGIVVGRLQHEGILPHSRGNQLKQWFKWSFES